MTGSLTSVIDKAISEMDREQLSGVRALAPRLREFKGGPQRMRLAGVAMVPSARDALNRRLDQAWTLNSTIREPRVDDGFGHDEIVIGAGLHAAIYCACRPYPSPLVIGGPGPVGGEMATTVKNGAWWLNNRNEPGESVGQALENQGVGHVPGAVFQVSDFAHGKFATNADLAFVVRVTLALNAKLRLGSDVVRWFWRPDASGGPFDRRFRVVLEDGSEEFADRVLDARGVGQPDLSELFDGKTVMGFRDLMARMDGESFPLRGMRRVAVIGSGNSALCAVESLLGAGPSAGFSVPSLDCVSQVDLYGESLPDSRDEWRERMRGRYQAIGSFLRVLDNGVSRLRVFQQAGSVSRTAGGAIVNDRVYDHVIVCAGFSRSVVYDYSSFTFYPVGASGQQGSGDSSVARRALIDEDAEFVEAYEIGAAAGENIAMSRYERQFPQLGTDNSVALWRMGPKTASLAVSLGAPDGEVN